MSAFFGHTLLGEVMEAVCWIIKIIVRFVCKKLSKPKQCHVCVALFHVTTICSTTLSLSHWNNNYRNVWINNCSKRTKALFQFVVINPFARIALFLFSFGNCRIFILLSWVHTNYTIKCDWILYWCELLQMAHLPLNALSIWNDIKLITRDNHTK